MEFDESLLNRNANFPRSFSSIRAAEIQRQIDLAYTQNRFWPNPLITINPRCIAGNAIDHMVSEGTLNPELRQIFSVSEGRVPIRLHHHQERSVAKAQSGEKFIVPTGTGSDESFYFFVSIIDAIVRARRLGEGFKTQVIIIYPKNALANSQLD